MEAPLHQSPVSLLHSPLHVVGVQRQQQEVVVAPAMAAAGGREQCPRCASRDTKFCYYNNYNTAQPRHFCRACRRYWTLGGSLRNVPIGGSTRKRPRPARPTRAAVAAAIAAAATASSSQVQAGQQQAAGAAPPVSQHEAASGGGGGGFVVSLLGAAPLLEGLLGGIGFDLGLGQPAGEVQALSEQLGFGAGAMAMAPAPLLWPARILEGDTWKSAAAAGVYSPFPAAAALWQELAAAAPVELAGGLLRHGGGAPQLM